MSIARVRVTTITEVLDHRGEVITAHTQRNTETAGNPAFVTRQAHRLSEQNADETRVALQGKYGEVEEAWRTA